MRSDRPTPTITTTDAGGRFVIGSITPGVYRVTAIKTGYIAAIDGVNTLLRATIDLVLRPMPQPGQPGSESVLEDMSWALRVPKRSIMREIDSRELLASKETGGVRAFAARVVVTVHMLFNLIYLGTALRLLTARAPQP